MTSPVVSSARLGNISFRLNPSQVFFSYDMDTKVIPTIGGRVVQVYGCTLGDMTIQGMFGQDRGGHRESWQLAEDFQKGISGIVKAQSTPPSAAQLKGTDATPMHQPVRFVFNDDTPARRAAGLPVHNWDLMVYVKSLKDIKSGFTVTHETGKFSYAYQLTLFIVEDNTGTLLSGVVDDFVTSLADGVGWAQSTYNGPMTTADVNDYLAKNSPDGTIHGLLLKDLAEQSLAFNNIQSQIAAAAVPGVAGTVGTAGTAPPSTAAAGASSGGSQQGGKPGAATGPTTTGKPADFSSLTPQNDPNYAADVASEILRQKGGR